MKSTKLLEILESFDENELAWCRKFIHSPFHNRHKASIDLYDWITSHARTQWSKLSKQDAYQAVFVGLKYDDSKMRRLMHNLYEAIRSFTAFYMIKDQADLLAVFQAESLTAKGLDNHLKTPAKTKEAIRTVQYLRTYQTNQILYNYEASRGKRTALDTIPKLLDEADIYFIVLKLKHGCLVLNQKKLFKQEIEIDLIDEILGMIKQKSLYEIELVSLFYYAYLMLKQPDEEAHFDKLVNALQQSVEVVHQSECAEALRYAINYCIARINAGEKVYTRKIFDLYRFGLDTELLLAKGQISPFTYRNIASAAVRLDETAWASGFVEQYRPKVDADNAEDFYALSMARVLFAQQKYDEVVSLMHQRRFKDLFAELGTRLILLKAFYELQEFQLLESMIDNYRQMVNRKKLQSYHHDNYSNTANIFYRLVRVNQYDSVLVQKLKDDILNTQPLLERDWFLGKVG